MLQLDDLHPQFGRAFEPGNKYHKYEPAELKLMESFETLDYKEPQSQIYKVCHSYWVASASALTSVVLCLCRNM